MKDNETPEEKTRRKLTTIPRPFAVCIDGIWRMVYGVYIEPLKEPFKVKCVFNGKEVLVTSHKKYTDYHGYRDEDVEYAVVKKNIATLPKSKIQIEPPCLPPRRTGRLMQAYYRTQPGNHNWGAAQWTARAEQQQGEAQPAQEGPTVADPQPAMNAAPDRPEPDRPGVYIREIPTPGGNVLVPMQREPEPLPEIADWAIAAPETPGPAPQTQP